MVSTGTGVSPSFSDILSISRGIFKWLRQQQVVNPFFKGSTATVRFEVARVKSTPSGDLLVFFTPSLTAASVSPSPGPLAVPFPAKPRSRHEPANLYTFSNHAVSFPIPPLREDPSTTTRVTRGKKDFLSLEIRCSGEVCTFSFELVQRIPRNEFIRSSSGVFLQGRLSPRWNNAKIMASPQGMRS